MEKSVTTTITAFNRIRGTRKKTPITVSGTVDNQFAGEGTWLRANLHCHLDRPGKEEWRRSALAHYRRLGYDVVAGMDHDKIVSPPDQPGIIVVPGAEVSCGGHLLAIGIDALPEAAAAGPRAETIAATIGRVRAAGGLAILAHPFKSAYTWAELTAFCAAGLDGIEVVNSNVRGKGADSGRADQLWHNLLREGHRLIAIGNDDAHGPHEDLAESGWGGVPHVAFTGILARERSARGVLEALRAFRSYASEGPEIKQITVSEDGKMTVRCSPCVGCHFRSVGGSWGGASVHSPDGQAAAGEFVFDFAHQGYRIQEQMTIVLQDVHGRRAWTSPLRVDITAEAS